MRACMASEALQQEDHPTPCCFHCMHGHAALPLLCRTRVKAAAERPLRMQGKGRPRAT